MARPSEEISKSNAQSGGRPDANLANDALHLGGIPAEDYATKKYVDDHMGNSEQKQKKYIDEQDQKILDEAKEYTNTQIRSQDFSGFAKVTDVQALDKKLQEKITEGDNAQKNYTDQKTKAIVDDVNANFQDVNNAMSTLNGNMNELFQSVSNGKSQIAGAITDKGVPTSASDSFSTMANNISQIKTGSGGGGTPIIPEGYYDTSDATATAEDIRSGKVAYGKDGYMIGTLNPSSGIDTSNATATAEDIAYGKTAYARGQLLIGTMQSSVEEIYGISSDPYTVEKLHGLLTNYNIDNGTTDGERTSRTLLAFTKDNSYCVSLVNLKGDSNQYIESLAVGEDGMYIQGTINASGETNLLKYRYTKEELGIEEEEKINCIALGKGGLDGDEKKCLLAIATVIDKDTGDNNYSHTYKVHFYTYHISDNGQIGKINENENIYVDNLIYSKTINSTANFTTYVSVASANLQYDEFIVSAVYDKGYSATHLNAQMLHFRPIPIETGSIIAFDYGEKMLTNREAPYITTNTDFRFTDDDKFVLNNIKNKYDKGIPFYSISTEKNVYAIVGYRKTNLKNDFFIIGDYYLQTKQNSESKLEMSQILSTQGEISIDINNAKTITLKFEDKNINEVSCYLYDSLNKKLFVIGTTSTKLTYLGIFNADGITDLPDQSILEAEQVTEMLYANDTKDDYYNNCNDVLVPDTNYTNILSYGKEYLARISNSVDVENIIGVIYKGKKFYSIKQGDLSAGGSDVKAGKTFIGYMGEIETGTLEVSE